MPRYLFQVQDGTTTLSSVNQELADYASAQDFSIKLACNLLATPTREFWDCTGRKITVAEETGETLFTLRFSAISGKPGAGEMDQDP